VQQVQIVPKRARADRYPAIFGDDFCLRFLRRSGVRDALPRNMVVEGAGEREGCSAQPLERAAVSVTIMPRSI
jgi:hypothetical protein